MVLKNDGGGSKKKDPYTKSNGQDRAGGRAPIIPPVYTDALKAQREQDRVDNLAIQKAKNQIYKKPPKAAKAVDSGSHDRKDKNPTPDPPKVQPAPSQSAVYGGEINSNIYDLYLAEIKRLTLKLVDSAKYLLLAYDFSGINRISEEYLDSDQATKTYESYTSVAIPQSIRSISQNVQINKTNEIVNYIAQRITDAVSDVERFTYFGSYVGSQWQPGVAGIKNGQSYYDLIINVYPNSGINQINVELYEI